MSVLASDQEHFAAHFAGQRVSDIDPAFVWENDLPLLDGALAHVGCRVVDVHPAGDHVLWIGEVEHLYHREGEPLLFYTGRFGTLKETSDREAAAQRGRPPGQALRRRLRTPRLPPTRSTSTTALERGARPGAEARS